MLERVAFPQLDFFALPRAMENGIQIVFDPVKGPGHLTRDPQRRQGPENQSQNNPPYQIIHPDVKERGHPQRKKDPSAHQPEDPQLRLFGDDEPERIPPLRNLIHDE